jgi:hypothetical protein
MTPTPTPRREPRLPWNETNPEWLTNEYIGSRAALLSELEEAVGGLRAGVGYIVKAGDHTYDPAVLMRNAVIQLIRDK